MKNSNPDPTYNSWAKMMGLDKGQNNYSVNFIMWDMEDKTPITWIDFQQWEFEKKRRAQREMELADHMAKLRKDLNLSK
jgi:hypothetical protein